MSARLTFIIDSRGLRLMLARAGSELDPPMKRRRTGDEGQARFRHCAPARTEKGIIVALIIPRRRLTRD